MIAETSGVQWIEAICAIVSAASAATVAFIAVRALNRFDDARLAGLDRDIADLDETARLLRSSLRDPSVLVDSPLLFGTIVHALSQHSKVASEAAAADALDKFAKDDTGRNVIEGWIVDLDAAKALKVAERAKVLERGKHHDWRARFG